MNMIEHAYAACPIAEYKKRLTVLQSLWQRDCVISSSTATEEPWMNEASHIVPVKLSEDKDTRYFHKLFNAYETLKIQAFNKPPEENILL